MSQTCCMSYRYIFCTFRPFGATVQTESTPAFAAHSRSDSKPYSVLYSLIRQREASPLRLASFARTLQISGQSKCFAPDSPENQDSQQNPAKTAKVDRKTKRF